MKFSSARIVSTATVVLVSGLLIFLSVVFVVLRVTVGHSAGNQERRQLMRNYVQRVHKGQAVSIQTADGVSLAGILIKRPDARGTVILCHGYRHSKELMARYLGMFTQYNVLLFDFRAFGQSGGFYSSIGYYESNDVKAAIAFVRQEIPAGQLRPLVVLGVSMGAAAALKAAAETAVGIDGLILDSPYATLSEILDEAANKFIAIPKSVLNGVAWGLQRILGPICEMSPEKYISRVTVPVFFIHSCSDSTTNASHSMRLFKRMSEGRRAWTWLWLTPPAKHACSFISYPRWYAKRVHCFLENLCG
ncbi:MAG: uncharacterized protein QG632_686 [Candidatus Dependentiae bacterium]|nr:uncharacterized protein [Candidatus Dependentiae bacterium]